MPLCVIVWYCEVLYGAVCHCEVLCHCVILRVTVRYCVPLCVIVWYCEVLCGTVRYCTCVSL